MKNLLSSSYSLFLMLHKVLKLAKFASLCYNDTATANQKYLYGLLVNWKNKNCLLVKIRKYLSVNLSQYSSTDLFHTPPPLLFTFLKGKLNKVEETCLISLCLLLLPNFKKASLKSLTPATFLHLNGTK